MINIPAIVIDGPNTAAWMFPDEAAGEPLESLGSSELHTPLLFWAEMRNILVHSEKRNRLMAETLQADGSGGRLNGWASRKGASTRGVSAFSNSR